MSGVGEGVTSGVADGITILSLGLTSVGIGELDCSAIPAGRELSGLAPGTRPLLSCETPNAAVPTATAKVPAIAIFLPRWPLLGALISGVRLPPKGAAGSTDRCDISVDSSSMRRSAWHARARRPSPSVGVLRVGFSGSQGQGSPHAWQDEIEAQRTEAVGRGTHCAPENGSIERERLPRRRPARVGRAHVFRQGDRLLDDLRGLDRPVLVAAEGLFQQVGEGTCLDDVPTPRRSHSTTTWSSCPAR